MAVCYLAIHHMLRKKSEDTNKGTFYYTVFWDPRNLEVGMLLNVLKNKSLLEELEELLQVLIL